jgi:hypothetical protein
MARSRIKIFFSIKREEEALKYESLHCQSNSVPLGSLEESSETDHSVIESSEGLMLASIGRVRVRKECVHSKGMRVEQLEEDRIARA